MKLRHRPRRRGVGGYPCWAIYYTVSRPIREPSGTVTLPISVHTNRLRFRLYIAWRLLLAALHAQELPPSNDSEAP